MIAKMADVIVMVATGLRLGHSGSSLMMLIIQTARPLVQRVLLLCVQANRAMRDI